LITAGGISENYSAVRVLKFPDITGIRKVIDNNVVIIEDRSLMVNVLFFWLFIKIFPFISHW
jgi:hypothetical protein